MQTVTLGASGLRVSRIALGTWQVGGDWGAFDERRATEAIRGALERGVTLFDTAQAYGFGASERLLGRALEPELRSRRDEVVIATKGGLRPEGGGLVRDASPEWLRSGLEDSLRALGVDHVDLLQVHWPDPTTPAEATGEALRRFVEEGKVAHVGVSNYDAAQMAALAETLPVETLQPPYHLFRREIEAEILPWCRAHDVGVLVYGPLAHGLLGGHIDRDTTFPDDDWRASSRDFREEPFARNLRVVEELRAVAGDLGLTLPQLGIAWTLAHPAVHVSIVGSRSPDHLDESLGAGDLRLDADVLERIDGIMRGGHPVHGATPEGA